MKHLSYFIDHILKYDKHLNNYDELKLDSKYKIRNANSFK